MATNDMSCSERRIYDFLLVCLDLSLDSLLNESRFRVWSSIIHRYADLNEALAFTASIRYKQVLFVVSDHFAIEALARIQTYRHVRDIFIFNRSFESLQINFDHYEALLGIFHAENELHDAVQAQIVSKVKQVVPFSVFDQRQQSTKDLSKEFNAFLWYQVLFHTLKQMPSDRQAKEEMLQICSNYYQQDPRQERIIQEYRQSSTEYQAIYWYTRNTFFFNLANQALRTEDMFLVYQFRYWIKELCTAIECEHRKKADDHSWTFYRGFQLHEDELERLKNSSGSLISINSFLSTSQDIAVARMFSGQGIMEGQLVSVILEIRANRTHLQSVFFADIHQISQFPDEMEVLFSLGSTFRIISVDFEAENNYWLVRLEASDDRSDQINQYCRLADFDFHRISPMIYFGSILTKNLDQMDRAVRYFHELLRSVDDNHPDFAEIYDALGDAYFGRNDINRAMKCYEKQRSIYRKQFNSSSNSSDNKVREDLLTSLEELEKTTTEATLEKANLLYNIGFYSDSGQAELWFSKTLQIYEQLKLASPSMSNCMKELAWTYRWNGKDQQCLDVQYRCLSIEEEYLPDDNQQLCESLRDIMTQGKTPDHHRRFVEFCQRKLLVLGEKLAEDHPRLIHMRGCVTDIQEKVLRFEEEQTALLCTLASIDHENLEQISQLLDQISLFYYRHDLYNESIPYALDSLKIKRRMYVHHHPMIISTLGHIADCYDLMSDYRQAFVYMEEILRLYRSIEHITPQTISETHSQIDRIVRKAAKNQIELDWTPLAEADPALEVRNTNVQRPRPVKPIPWWARPSSKSTSRKKQ